MARSLNRWCACLTKGESVGESVFNTIDILTKNLLLLLGAGLFLLMPGPAGSQTPETDDVPSLSATIEKNTARIGDMLWLTFKYELPAECQTA